MLFTDGIKTKTLSRQLFPTLAIDQLLIDVIRILNQNQVLNLLQYNNFVGKYEDKDKLLIHHNDLAHLYWKWCSQIVY